jgi:Cys-tRNA(Pro)/Cys-tRNA(Cys) deacylase
MLGPLDIHQYLLAHDVHHEIVRVPRPAATAGHLAEVLGVPPQRCLAIHPFHAMSPDGDVLVLLLAPADVRTEPTQLIDALADLLKEDLGPSAALTLAGADLVSSRTDYIAGHLAPLLLSADVIVVATQGLVDLGTSVIYTATGDAGTALGIGALDLLALSHARFLPDTARPGRGPWIELDRKSTAIHLPRPAAVEVGTPSNAPPSSGTALNGTGLNTTELHAVAAS